MRKNNVMKQVVSFPLLVLLMLTLLGAQESFHRYRGFGFAIGNRGSGLLFQQGWSGKKPWGLTLEGRFYDIKGEDEMLMYDPYTGQTFTVNDKSLLLVPVFGGVEYYPFYGRIANNFLPFTFLKLGPLLALDAEETGSFTKRWRRAQTHVTLGGQLGIGVHFFIPSGMNVSFGMGWDFLPMAGTVDDRTDYNGLLLSLAFTWRK